MKNEKAKSSKLLVIPVIAVLLTLTIASVAPSAFAVSNCDGPHCYTTVKKGTDNRGGGVTIDINSGNSIESGYAIANPLWISFDNGEWAEGGWEKGYILPCVNNTAKYYWYETVGTTTSECIGTTSGSTMTVLITDSNLNDTYLIYVNGGSYEKSVVNTDDAIRMTVGGESTHQDNVLDNGQDQSLTIIYPTGTTYSWGASNLTYSDDESYTNGWNTQYTDFHYEGP